MKKYVKPDLFYEQFELSRHIADCAWEPVNSTKNSCPAKGDGNLLPGYEEIYLFMDSSNGCDLIPGVNYGDYCYQDGASGVNVFNS